jgi:hypothetical protein
MNTLIFPLTFLFLFILCAWIIIGCKGFWASKFWLINICAIFFFVFWFSVTSFLGWPSSDRLPYQFRLGAYVSHEPECLYVVAIEPKDDKWNIRKAFEYKTNDIVRIYRFPYDKKMHENLEKAMERVNKGNYVIMSKTKILDGEELKGFNEVQNFMDGFSQLQSSSQDPYRFYLMPPSKLIKKPD